jgi:hypothetical protein
MPYSWGGVGARPCVEHNVTLPVRAARNLGDLPARFSSNLLDNPWWWWGGAGREEGGCACMCLSVGCVYVLRAYARASQAGATCEFEAGNDALSRRGSVVHS